MRISDWSSDVCSSDLFQKAIGLAKNILSARLKKLVEHDIFRIEPDADNGVGHRYVLTAKGERLYVVLMALWQWGERTGFKPHEARYAMFDRQTGEPLAKSSEEHTPQLHALIRIS